MDTAHDADHGGRHPHGPFDGRTDAYNSAKFALPTDITGRPLSTEGAVKSQDE